MFTIPFRVIHSMQVQLNSNLLIDMSEISNLHIILWVIMEAATLYSSGVTGNAKNKCFNISGHSVITLGRNEVNAPKINA